MSSVGNVLLLDAIINFYARDAEKIIMVPDTQFVLIVSEKRILNDLESVKSAEKTIMIKIILDAIHALAN